MLESKLADRTLKSGKPENHFSETKPAFFFCLVYVLELSASKVRSMFVAQIHNKLSRPELLTV
jgi:hypothetical protein